MSNLLYPGPIQSATGAPAPQPAPMIPQQQLQAPTFAQRFQSNMGPILQALGYGIAANDLSRGAAMIPGLAERRQEQVMQQQQMAQEQQRRNATVEWAKTQDPEVAQMLGQGIIGPMDAVKMIQQRRQAKQGGDVQYYGNPIYGTGPDGKPRIGQLGNNGTIKWSDGGEVDISTGVDKVDAGTHWILQDKRSGQVVGTLPKNNAEAAAETARGAAIGGAEGAATVAAPKDLQAAENALGMINSIRNDPAKGIGTGASSVMNAIPGTPGYGFQTKVDQLKAGAFMTAIGALRGMGALSNAEGQTATAAVTRMTTAMSQEDFDAALNEYERIVRQGYEKAAKISGGGAPINPDMPPAEDPLGLR